ncbi:M1 family metallopeptidase [Flagellimonas beolgyonensis]|uniref:M1 family metallopeptidase n=1 Tax=Flagellimonas beolgyonensis TaxID=864064 RepID=UPI003D65A2FD
MLWASNICVSQQPAQNNQDLFGEFMDRSGTVFRSASGKPGPEYWQNTADYKIQATLDDSKQTLTGRVTMTYTNNSPENLDFIWMYLDQNRFTETSRGTLTTPIQGNRYNGDMDGGYSISNLRATVKKGISTKYLVDDTRMQVFFNEPIPAKGGKATVSMDFSFRIPVKGMDRMGRLETQNGTIYAIAQWYPKVAVFDDIEGWNTEPYLGAGEFYDEYGDYEYSITVPFDQIVVGSGVLQNPNEVLTTTVRNRMDLAKKSDERVFLIKPEELGDPTLRMAKQGNTTWRFKMQQTRDVAFACSKAFIWDAAAINLPSGKKALAQSVYPIESSGDPAWGRSTEYTKNSIEHYSRKWLEYPYPVAVNVAADIGGMEYPGLSFCSWKSKGADLWGVTDHEFGHNWFPMIVGSNERRYPWMDEGFNTFINHYSSQEFNHGEYPDRLSETRGRIQWYLDLQSEGIDTYPDVVNTRNLGMTAYVKPATGLLLLREYILGEERFDNAFTSYIRTWAYKHPQPKDFFNIMDNVSGENLSWFWKGWFYGTGKIDLAIDNVIPYQGDYVIVLSNKGDMPMPVVLEITYTDTSWELIHLPVEIWQRGNSWNYLLKSDKVVKKVQIDPEKLIPDVNPSNDTWPDMTYVK